MKSLLANIVAMRSFLLSHRTVACALENFSKQIVSNFRETKTGSFSTIS